MRNIISFIVAALAVLLSPDQAAPQNATAVTARAVFQGRHGIGGINTFGSPRKGPKQGRICFA